MSGSDETNEAIAHWKQAPRVVQRHLPNGVLLLAPGMETSLAITGPAASVWDLLAEARTRPELTNLLAATYDTTPARVEADLTETWDQLVACHIIEPVAP